MASVRVAPEAGVEQLAPTEFSTGEAVPWLRLDVGRVPAGKWVRLAYRTNLASDPIRPLLRIERRDEAPAYAILPAPVRGWASWIGRLPEDANGLAISPVRGESEFAVAIDEFAPMSRGALLAGALRRHPRMALHAAWLRVRGLTRRARHMVAAIWASTPPDQWAEWRREGARPPLPDPEPLRRRLDKVTFGVGETAADWVLMLRPGDVLLPHASRCLAAAALRDPAATVIAFDGEGPDSPVLMPAWSPRLQQAPGYLDRAAIRTDVDAAVAAEPGQRIAAALAMPDSRMAQVRRVLVRSTAAPPSFRGSRSESPEPIHADATGRSGTLVAPLATSAFMGSGLSPSAIPGMTALSTVSVVIPNRDSPALIRTCVDGLLNGTAYPSPDLVIVDNGSVDPDTLAFYRSLRDNPAVQVLDRPGPFNFSALTNAGVAASSGRFVLLLNNDIEVLDPDWLSSLVEEANVADVGAVGARLLYPDGRIQHAGVVIGLGGHAGHIYRGRRPDTPGWMRCLEVPHEVSAVTGACLLVSRENYDAVGGLDEAHFPVSFNDIDFCLKLRERGLRNLLVPAATLIHHESVSRGRDVGAKQARADREGRLFEERWRHVMRDDPYFHPAFSLARFDPHLG